MMIMQPDEKNKVSRSWGILALGVGVGLVSWIATAGGPDESAGRLAHESGRRQSGEAIREEQSLAGEESAAPLWAMTTANASGVTPLESAITAARQLVSQTGEVGGTRPGDSSSQTFGNDPATQVTLRKLEDGKVSVGPAGGGSDWGLVFSEEVSRPVGYETIKAHPDAFTLLGTRLFTNPVAEGEFEMVSGNVLTDSDTDFDAIFISGVSYAIELESGAANGTLVKVASFAGSELTIAESLPPGSSVNYTIRPVLHLSALFEGNPDLVKVADFNPDTGDLILVPTSDGNFDHFYYSSYPGLEGLFNAATGLAEDPELVSTKALIFLRRGATPLNLVISGSVKLSDTLLTVADTFGYFSSIYPAGETLGVSRLEDSLQAGNAETADLIWMEVGAGEYQQYFYSDGTPPLTAGWRQVGAGDADQEGVIFSSGFAIHRRVAAPYDALLTPPSFYSDL